MSNERWPALPYDEWQETYATLLSEFILPYDAVRTAPSPDNAIQDFIDSTYAAAANLAHWDRAALER